MSERQFIGFCLALIALAAAGIWVLGGTFQGTMNFLVFIATDGGSD